MITRHNEELLTAWTGYSHLRNSFDNRRVARCFSKIQYLTIFLDLLLMKII